MMRDMKAVLSKSLWFGTVIVLALVLAPAVAVPGLWPFAGGGAVAVFSGYWQLWQRRRHASR